MPLNNYGVVKGYVLKRRKASKWDSHYQILIQGRQYQYRASVNVKSDLFPSELLYYSIHDFEHPMTEELAKLHIGFEHVRGRIALDYIRDNAFDPADMVVLPYDKPGPDNDLNEKLDALILPMIRTEDDDNPPIIYAFGEGWGRDPSKSDPIFNFWPDQGIHDIHMNQGNMPNWQYQDGIWQDGGLVFYYPSENRWAAAFLAFQTQAFHTDDKTGMRLLPESTPEHPEPPAQPNIPARTDDIPVKIVKALVNPLGNDIGKETVTIKNMTDELFDLEGWYIADKHDRRDRILNIMLEPNDEYTVELDGTGAILSNQGGIITLLNKKSMKIHGVAYTRQQAKKEDRIIEFS